RRMSASTHRFDHFHAGKIDSLKHWLVEKLIAISLTTRVTVMGFIFDSNSVVMQLLNPLRVHLENLLFIVTLGRSPHCAIFAIARLTFLILFDTARRSKMGTNSCPPKSYELCSTALNRS